MISWWQYKQDREHEIWLRWRRESCPNERDQMWRDYHEMKNKEEAKRCG